MVLESIDADGRAQTVTVEVMPEGQEPPFVTSPIHRLALNAVWCAPEIVAMVFQVDTLTLR
jgi:hypothetical protein